MIDETDAADVEGDAPIAVGPLDVAVVRIEDRAGAMIQEVSVPSGVILRAVDGAGMLRDDGVVEYPSLTAEGRYDVKAARLIATLHGPHGEAYRRHRWSCDGYGRIISADVEEL